MTDEEQELTFELGFMRGIHLGLQQGYGSGINIGRQIGEQSGQEEMLQLMARKMLLLNIPFATVVKITKLPKEMVEAIVSEVRKYH